MLPINQIQTITLPNSGFFSRPLFSKIGRIALAVITTLGTLFFSLYFAWGRKLWANINLITPIVQPQARLPADAFQILSNWLKNRKNEKYTLNDILPAFNYFQNQCRCRWQDLKTSNAKTFMQVIHDLREAYLEKYFEILLSKYPGTAANEFHDKLNKINNFGSNGLTSDCDFSFYVGNNYVAKEAEIAHEFNTLFEKEWGAPSAVVFDSNAYTTQYILTASDPQIELERAQLQQEASLLMKLKTSSKDHWEQFKQATLQLLMGNYKVQANKAEEFKKIESIQFALNKELLTEVLCPNVATLSPDAITKAIHELEENDLPRFVTASNKLFAKYKSEMTILEEDRVALLKCRKSLYENEDSQDFAKLFNQQVTLFKRYSQQQLITPGQEIETMKAFKERIDHENYLQRAQKERLHLDEIQHLLKKYRILQKNSSIPDTVLECEKKKVEEALFKITQMPIVDITSTVFAKNLNSKIALADKLIAIRQKEYEEKKKKYSKTSPWQIAGALSTIGDRILLEIQRKNLIGNYFMRESHGSEGACAVVIENIQAGLTILRTPNQYLQAFREISGYFSGHQSHKMTAKSKIVEVSKYAVRMLLVIELIKDRGKEIGIQHTLKMKDDTLKKSAKLFARLASFRRKGSSGAEMVHVMEDIAATLKLTPSGEFQEQDITLINSRMIDLSAALEAWCAIIQHDTQESQKFNKPFRV